MAPTAAPPTAPQIGLPPAIAVIPAPAAAPMAPPDNVRCCVSLLPDQPVRIAATPGTIINVFFMVCTPYSDYLPDLPLGQGKRWLRKRSADSAAGMSLIWGLASAQAIYSSSTC